MTMQNPKSELKKEQFKEELKKRIKQFILNLIQFIGSLSKDTTCKIIADQLAPSGTSIRANYFEVRAASSKNDFTNFFSAIGGSTSGRREVSEIANIFTSSIFTMKGKK